MNEQDLENIMQKSRKKIAISQFKKENIVYAKKDIGKMIASIILVLVLSASGVYAGTVTYTKIWKEPKSYKFTQEITEEEKAKCISEKEAEELGNAYLKKIGLTDENIKGLQLTKQFFSNENIWELSSEKASIVIDAEKGTIKSVYIPTWKYTIPYNYGITREEAMVTAKELLEKYRPEDDKGEYELVKLTRNMNTDEASYIWYAVFQKKYEDLLNPAEEIYIGWVPTINGLYTLSFKRNAYEGNQEVIGKEEAIQIVTQKDNTIETERKIQNIKAEIRIKQMNENVYLRENFKEDYESGKLNLVKIGENSYRYKEDAIFYKTEERVRKVWVVVVEYESKEGKIPSYTYFVDITTGEIIGGGKADSLYAEEQVKNDPYNLIEK